MLSRLMIDQGNLINTPLQYKTTPEVFHEAETLNIDDETIRERIEEDMDFKIPGLPRTSASVRFGARCSSYECCFAFALTRHSGALREAEASVVRWGKCWLSAATMACMEKAIDGSGAVDQAKMHACSGNNIIDLSFLNFPMPAPVAEYIAHASVMEYIPPAPEGEYITPAPEGEYITPAPEGASARRSTSRQRPQVGVSATIKESSAVGL